jgi:hypothetical protein
MQDVLVRMSFLDAAPEAVAAGTLHRALRADVRFPFVVIGAGEEYEVAAERGTVDIEGGVLLIAPFEVPDGEDDAFLAAREAARAVLAEQRGHMGTRLLRATGDPAFRYVDVTRWSSPLMHARALALPELPPVGFPAHPALYSVVALD